MVKTYKANLRHLFSKRSLLRKKKLIQASHSHQCQAKYIQQNWSWPSNIVVQFTIQIQYKTCHPKTQQKVRVLAHWPVNEQWNKGCWSQKKSIKSSIRQDRHAHSYLWLTNEQLWSWTVGGSQRTNMQTAERHQAGIQTQNLLLPTTSPHNLQVDHVSVLFSYLNFLKTIKKVFLLHT